MALTRKFLSALGIEADKIDEIINAHTETTDGLKDELAKVKADAAKLAEVQAELDALKAQPEDGYKAKYEKERDDFKAYKADVAAREALAAKKAAYEEVCKDAGLNDKGVAKALKYADWNAVELDETGKVKDAKDHIKALKEEWAEHVVTTTTQGANTPNPPANNGGKPYKTKEEIYAIKDAAERQQAILDNHELFGI